MFDDRRLSTAEAEFLSALPHLRDYVADLEAFRIFMESRWVQIAPLHRGVKFEATGLFATGTLWEVAHEHPNYPGEFSGRAQGAS
jgi:hypothetical protein